jgi:hypothetical protein
MRAGVTGHRDLGPPEAAAWVRAALAALVADPRLTGGATSLAAGADQLFATLLAEAGKPYTVIVPCEQYERTFGRPADTSAYRRLLHRAREKVTLPFAEPSEQAFWAAGMKVVDTTDSTIAVWDGRPAKGLGGTADVVRYALTHGKQVIHINPMTRTVTTAGA